MKRGGQQETTPHSPFLSNNPILVFDQTGRKVELEDREYVIKRTKENNYEEQIEVIFTKICKNGHFYQVQILNQQNEQIFQLFVKAISSHTAVQILRKW